MRFVVEAGNVVVRLRLEVRGKNSPLGIGREERQPPPETRLRINAVMKTVFPERAEAGHAEAEIGRDEIETNSPGTRPQISHGGG